MARSKARRWTSEEGLRQIQAWARSGLTDEQIAHNCAVHPTTIYAWKKKYDELSKALEQGKEVVDLQVENALFRRALGYSYEEIIRETVASDKNNSGASARERVITRTVSKHVAPDVTAQIFWLKNRKPEEWRNNPKDHTLEKTRDELQERLLLAKTRKAEQDAEASQTAEMEVVFDKEILEKGWSK